MTSVPVPAAMPGDLVEQIAAFLLLRDEMVTDPDERTDDERAASAQAIFDLFAPILAEKERLERVRHQLYSALESKEDHAFYSAEWASRCAARRVDAEARWAQVAIENSDLSDALAKAEARALAAEAALAGAGGSRAAYFDGKLIICHPDMPPHLWDGETMQKIEPAAAIRAQGE